MWCYDHDSDERSIIAGNALWRRPPTYPRETSLATVWLAEARWGGMLANE